MSSFYFVVF